MSDCHVAVGPLWAGSAELNTRELSASRTEDVPFALRTEPDTELWSQVPRFSTLGFKMENVPGQSGRKA